MHYSAYTMCSYSIQQLPVNPVFPLLITSSEAADSNVGDGSRPVDNSAWVFIGWCMGGKIQNHPKEDNTEI